MAINQLKAGAILNYIALGLNTVLGLTYTPFMLRMLGQSEYGIYSLAASIIAYLSIIDFGLGNAVIRYTAKYRSDKERQYRLFGMFTILYCAIALLAIAASALLILNIENIFGATFTSSELERTKVIILLMGINLAVTFPLSIYGAIITAYEDFVFMRVVQICKTLLSTIVMIALLYIGYKAIALVVVQTLFNMIVLGLNYFYCRRCIHIKVMFQKIERSLLGEIIVYSFWIFLNAITDRIYWSTGQFVLGATSGTEEVSVYALAIMLVQMYILISTAISGVFLPKITTMVTEHAPSQALSDLFIRTGRIQFIIICMTTSGFIIFGQQFIYHWAGPEYTDAYIMTLILFIALLPPLIQNIGISILQARNQMRFRCLLYVCLAIGSLFFQILLCNRFGSIGCSCAIGCVLFLGQGLIMNIYYSERQDINIRRFWTEISRMSVAPIIVTAVFILGGQYSTLNGWSGLSIGILCFLCVYMLTAWLFMMNGSERQLCLSLIRSIKRHVHNIS